MTCNNHCRMCRAVLQRIRYRPSFKESIDEGTAIGIAAAERFQQLDVVRRYLVCLIIRRIGNRARLAMLDDDDLRPLCNVLLRDQVICRLRRILIITLGEVDLIS